MKRRVRSVMAMGVLIGLAVSLCGCLGLPRGTRETVQVGKLQLSIKGAGLVKADTEKTTFRIKCGRCGNEPGDLTVDTPSVGNPYTLNWVCPQCRHPQPLIIEASGL
ncbi:MAG: hypothetical protein WCS52_16980 [bacterium]